LVGAAPTGVGEGHISLVRQKDFDYFVDRFFAADRMMRRKGMIEVIP
jgi:hypothetical protein